MSRARIAAVASMVIAVCSFPPLVYAQATRTWVSGVGADSNPCSRTAPCRTFAGAMPNTAAGGEIDTLDPGGYGAVTITKSIVIDGKAGLGSILAALVNGVIINAAGAVVVLRNLSINGVGSGFTGIRILQAAEVRIENCVIKGFTERGIDGPSPAFPLDVFFVDFSELSSNLCDR